MRIFGVWLTPGPTSPTVNVGSYSDVILAPTATYRPSLSCSFTVVGTNNLVLSLSYFYTAPNADVLRVYGMS